MLRFGIFFNTQILMCIFFVDSFKFCSRFSKVLPILKKVNSSITRFSEQQKGFNAHYYYPLVFACAAMFFLIIDGHTGSFLRTVSITTFIFSACLTSVTLIVAAQPQVISGSLIPIIRRCLFFGSYRSATIRQSLFALKIEEIHSQLMQKMIGITCGRLFIFTNETNLHALIMFATNVVLIIDLFQHYFLV